MKKMKKAMALALATMSVLSVSAMAACSGGGGGGGGEKVDANRTQIYVNNFSGGYGVEWLTEIKKAYEKEQENVCWEEGTEKKGVQIIINNTRANLTADNILGNNDEVYFTEHVYYQALLAENVFADLTPAVTGKNKYDNDKTIVSKFKTQQLNTLNVDNKYYAIPHYEGTYGLIYNKELFDSKGYYLIQNIADDTNVDDITLSDYFDVRKTGENYTAGPDGQSGTTDDGLPATYTEFFALCEWISRRNDTPLIWTGKYRVLHLTALLGTLLADYEGLDSMLAGVNFDGTQVSSLGKIVNGKFTLDGESVAINESNGHDVSRRAGVYYALQFLKNVFSNEKYYNEKAFSDGYSHIDAQTDFVWGGYDGTPNYAMLVDGEWWEEDASDAFSAMEDYYDETFAKKEREFGWMPLPNATSDKVSQKDAICDTRCAFAFVKSNVDADKLPLIYDFLQYVYSDEKLEEFTKVTGTIRALNYEISTATLNEMSPFGLSLYESKKKSDTVYLTSTSTLFAMNQETFDPANAFVAQGDWKNPVDVLSGNVSVEDYFNSVNNYFKGLTIWG